MAILGIGNPFVDRTKHVNEVPEGLERGQTNVVFEKEKVEALWKKIHENDDSKWSLGGSCTNVIKSLSCIIENSSCFLLGMVGKDKKQAIEKKLTDLHVKSLLVEGEADNGIVNCFVTPDSERTMQAFFGVSMELSEKHILSQHFENVSHVHLEGYLAYFENVLEFSTKHAQENRATISLDLSSIDVIANCSGRLKECAAKANIIFGNFEEMKKFTDCTEIESIFKYFKKEHIVVVTNGSQGGWFKAKGTDQINHFEAIETNNILDTTGAGDFFIAGFLAGFLGKEDISLSIKIANLAASYVIQQDGTELRSQKWQELKEAVKLLR